MDRDEDPAAERGEECTTTGSFADHDIEDGSALIERTYYNLADADRREFEPELAFYDALESAFIWAFLGSVDERGVPDHVAAAVDDARAFTVAEFEDAADADLRTEVIPSFYRYAAGFHCAYRQDHDLAEGSGPEP